MSMTLLSELKIGKTAVISSYTENKPRLVEMGIVPGAQLRMIKKIPFGGPSEIKVRDYYVSIRRADAEKIQLLEST